MKYKKQLATGALALSLLVSGSTIYAATPQDVGVKNVQKSYQKQNKEVIKTKKQDAVGIVSALTSSGFTLTVANLKTKVFITWSVINGTNSLILTDSIFIPIK